MSNLFNKKKSTNEFVRVAVFLLLISFYILTKIGFIIAIIHFLLYLINPTKFSISKILSKVLPY